MGVGAGLFDLSWGNLLMLIIGLFFIYLGIFKKMEPFLLIPIGFGVILANLPGAEMVALDGTREGKGVLFLIYKYGISSSLIPLLIFLGLGAAVDFSPTIARPISLIFGAGAQLGVFVTIALSMLLGFSPGEAASIGIIGGSDGPPTVYLTAKLAPQLLGPITLAAYSYMALVPIIQPPVIKLLTTKKERAIPMKSQVRTVSKIEQILFPFLILLPSALLIPKSTPLIGMLMLGNILKVSGVTERLAISVSSVFLDVLTVLLGLCVGALMPAEIFLRPQTLAIVMLSAIAFSVCTAGGILVAKLVNLFLKEPINPLIGAAGVSAVPMSARVVQKLGQEANPENFLLMHAMGPNAAGVIATSIVAGLLLTFFGKGF